MSTIIHYRGTSLTFGVGVTGSGGSGGAGTSTASSTYPKQTQALLGNGSLGMEIVGYPGQTSWWFASNQLNNFLGSLSPSDTHIVVYEWGANDIAATADGVQIYNSIRGVHEVTRARGHKTVLVPIVGRKDANSSGYTEPARQQANNLLNTYQPQFSDAWARVDQEPLMYSTNAPDNSTYFAENDPDGFSHVHWTSAGAGLIAAKVAPAIQSLLTPNYIAVRGTKIVLI